MGGKYSVLASRRSRRKVEAPQDKVTTLGEKIRGNMILRNSMELFLTSCYYLVVGGAERLLFWVFEDER